MSTFVAPPSYSQLMDQANELKAAMILTVHPGGSWTCIPISEEIMLHESPALAGNLWADEQKRLHDEVTKT